MILACECLQAPIFDAPCGRTIPLIGYHEPRHSQASTKFALPHLRCDEGRDRPGGRVGLVGQSTASKQSYRASVERHRHRALRGEVGRGPAVPTGRMLLAG